MALNEAVSPDLIARLHDDLTSAGFTVDALSRRWGADADAALHRGHRVPALRECADDSALSTLARFFVLNTTVSRDALDAALPTLHVAGALKLGLGDDDVRSSGSGIRPLLDLRPYSFIDQHGIGAWWIASDLGEVALGHALRSDHVLGVGGASATLSGLMMQEPVHSALDMGTGCGIQAMHAARHSGRVVATDISARALKIARLNAAVNGIGNIEFRLGSLFEPVKGERFDHIVSNPPFVITPRAESVPSYEYRDGGMVGDELVETVVRGAAEHLGEGGIAQLLGNWEYRADDALQRVAGWIDGAGLDAWVIEREVQDAALYAETWIRDGGTTPGRDFDALYNAWLDDFAARGVQSIGFGYLTLRRPAMRSSRGLSAPSLRRFERLSGAVGHNPTGLGGHLASCLAAHDRLVAMGDEQLGRAHLAVASDVTEERHYWPGAEDPTVMTLHQGGGFGRSVPLDTALAGFVGACDGELRTDAIIGAVSELLEVDCPALRKELLPHIRELLVTGFLAEAPPGE